MRRHGREPQKELKSAPDRAQSGRGRLEISAGRNT